MVEPDVRLLKGGIQSLSFAGRVPVRIVPRGLAAAMLWPALSCDLVELASAILVADRRVRRTRGGPRRIHLSLPVRRPSVWRGLRDELAGVLAILSEDDFTFAFRRSRCEERVLLPLPGRSEAPRLDRLALFSGGLDSAAAAAILVGDGVPTGFVTQYSRGLSGLEALLGEIHEEYGRDSAVHHAAFYLAPTGPVVPKLRENSRRTRAFLFASLALATAAGTGASEVLVCENGPLALNLPLSAAMVPTRHAHSLFLDAAGKLGTRLLGRSIRLANPFELATKGEMTRIFSRRPELALATASCWNQQWSGKGSSYGHGHCGFCFPCLVRLAALETAGIPIPAGHFETRIRKLAARRRLSEQDEQHLDAYRTLRDFAHTVRGCRTWKDLARRFPEVLEASPTSTSADDGKWLSRLAATMRRFADEILRSLEGTP